MRLGERGGDGDGGDGDVDVAGVRESELLEEDHWPVIRRDFKVFDLGSGGENERENEEDGGGDDDRGPHFERLGEQSGG